MARQFGAKGHDLALCARRAERLDELRGELQSAHPSIVVSVHALDVTDDDAVFRVFNDASAAHGGLDRIIVNAGLGKGAQIGTGRYDANRQTAMTNFVAALAQCEAAMELFRKASGGHLVVVSSMSAMRGMPRALTTYAATKAGIATLAEGIRADVYGTKIKVTTLYPGYIRSEMNERVQPKTRLMASTSDGVRAMVRAIDREQPEAAVPPWPWRPLGFVMRHAPLAVVRRMG